jgi:hypothetical protein
MKKGEIKYMFSYKEKDIARIAGVSMGAYRVAKVRGKIKPENLRSVAGFIFQHWVSTICKEPERCEHRHTKKEHPSCFKEE